MFAPLSIFADLLAASFRVVERTVRRRMRSTRRLLLLRHAEAERGSGVPDEARALTASGRAEASRLGRALAARGIVPDVVVSSPARRAIDTASLVVSEADHVLPVQAEARLYGQGLEGLLAVLRDLPDDATCALVVGHDPEISRSLERIAGAREGLPPGGLAELAVSAAHWSRIGEAGGRASLVGLWRPRSRSDVRKQGPRERGASRATKWFAARAEERVAEAAARVVEQRLDAVLDRLAMVADESEEAEDAVRKLRVATRRAEAALRAFRDVLPRRATVRVRKHLRGVRGATNAARDADMMSLRLATLASEDLRSLMQTRQRVARHEVRALCRRLSSDAKLARSVARLLRESWQRSADSSSSPRPFGEWAAVRIERSVERFAAVGAADLTDIEQLHALRLRTKKLRYELEIFSSVLPTGARSEAYPILTGLQDRLGEIHDAAVILEQLAGFARFRSDAAMAGSLEELARAGGVLLERACAELALWWTPERLARLMDQIRVRG
jgi:phosphohistidine phosphatase